ncbi:MAG: hypothetical protein JRN52_13715 [Nitrososphaerota archaeon]|nr:hypothetical protein [Nitrososphaerota archaeon]
MKSFLASNTYEKGKGIVKNPIASNEYAFRELARLVESVNFEAPHAPLNRKTQSSSKRQRKNEREETKDSFAKALSFEDFDRESKHTAFNEYRSYEKLVIVARRELRNLQFTYLCNLCW